MTFRQFLKEVRKCKGFRLTPSGMIRDQGLRCPIEVVVDTVRGGIYENGKRILGLSSSTISRIIEAADRPTWTISRWRLRRACGV